MYEPDLYETNTNMYIATVRRMDPFFEELLQHAGRAALYIFNSDQNVWEKSAVEGAMFFYRRKAKTQHCIVIVIRLNKPWPNFIEPVRPGDEIHMECPYLLYKTMGGKIYYFHFEEKIECFRMYQALRNLLPVCDVPEQEVAAASEVAWVKYDESMMDAIKKPYKISIMTNEDKIAKLTRKAQEMYNSTKTDEEETNANANDDTPKTHRHQMLSDSVPDPHFVEHIEKEQNSANPQQELPSSFNVPEQDQNLKTEDPRIKTASEPTLNVQETQKSFDSMCLSDTTSSSMDHSAQTNNTKPTSRLNKFIPTMEDQPVCNAGEPALQISDDTLLTPMIKILEKKMKKDAEAQPESASRIEPISKDQLLEAIHYLLDNDPDFIKSIHEAYILCSKS